MSVDRIQAIIDSAGKTVTVQRLTGMPPTVSATVTCKAGISGYRPEQLMGDILEGDRELRIGSRELDNANIAPRQGDQVIIDGHTMRVEDAYAQYWLEGVGLYVLRCRG